MRERAAFAASLALLISGCIVSWPHAHLPNSETLASNQNRPLGIAVYGGRVYWTTRRSSDGLTPGRVHSALIAGGDEQVVGGDYDAPLSLAADAGGIYFTETIENGRVADTPQTGFPFGIATDATHIYWTTFDGRVMRQAKSQ